MLLLIDLLVEFYVHYIFMNFVTLYVRNTIYYLILFYHYLLLYISKRL